MNADLKPNVSQQITPFERSRIVSSLMLCGADADSRKGRVLLVGSGGSACHELGEVQGVCVEAPLPCISIKEQLFKLEEVGGIASLLHFWGLVPVVSCPAGSGDGSALQRNLLSKEGIKNHPLKTGNPQIISFTRRIFAGGHQLAHVEMDEIIVGSTSEQRRHWEETLLDELRRSDLLCVVDKGNVGLTDALFRRPMAAAKRLGITVIYEPRSHGLLHACSFDVVKVNQKQIRQWVGLGTESDHEAIAACDALLKRAGARCVICTRGEQGIVVHGRVAGRRETKFIRPRPKKLFDLVSAGDVVTAGLAYCLARGTTPAEAACFAANAAELSLDRRYEKHIDLQSVLSRGPTPTTQ